MTISNPPAWLRRFEPVVLLARWVLARVLFAAAVYFGGKFLTEYLVRAVIYFTGDGGAALGAIEQDRVLTAFYVLTALLAALAYRPFLSWVDGQPADELAFNRNTLPAFMQGMLLATLMFALPVLIFAATGSIGFALPTTHRMLVTLAIAMHAAVIEEIVFRGILLQFVLKFCHPIFATLVVAALFMAAHIPDGRDSISLVSVFLSGMAMTVAYFLTRSLWLPIGLHFGWDVILFLLHEIQGTNRYAALPVSYFQVPLYLAEILVLATMIGIVTYRAMNPARSLGEPANSGTN